MRKANVQSVTECRLKGPECAKGALHAKGLCRVHYMRLKRGTVTLPKSEHADSAPSTVNVPAEFEGIRDTDVKKDGLVQITRGRVSRFLHEPYRAGKVLAQLYRRAFENDKVLLEYVKMLLPEQRTGSPIQININTHLLKDQEGVTYDIEGKEIDVSDVSSATTASR